MLSAFCFVCFAGAACAQSLPAEDSFSVCSYNLRNWLTMERMVKTSLKTTDKPEREKVKVVESIAAIAPAILGVCEIGSEADLNDLKDRLSKAGLIYPYTIYSHGGDPVRRLALLSRFPVVAQNNQTHLTYQIGEQVFPFQRGILDATVEPVPGFRLHLLGVHLKSKREVAEADQALMRRNEAHLLREHLDSLLKAHPEERVLLYGDFNEDDKEPGIEEIKGSRAVPALLMHEVAMHDDNGEVWTHFWQLHLLYSRLDYFFVSPALRPFLNDKDASIFTVRDFMAGSDHRPIVVNIDLTPSKAKKRR